MEKSTEETKGALEVKQPAVKKETKDSCGCGCNAGVKNK